MDGDPAWHLSDVSGVDQQNLVGIFEVAKMDYFDLGKVLVPPGKFSYPRSRSPLPIVLRPVMRKLRSVIAKSSSNMTSSNGLLVTALTISASLAKGVPVGGELDYLDDGTISAALSARKAL